MNQFQAIGRLTRDAETRTLGGNASASNLSLAINRKWKDKDGEWREEVLFIRASAFGWLSGKASGMKKGDLVFVVGHLESRKWTDKDGSNRESIEVKLSTLESINADKGGAKGDDDRRNQGSKKAAPAEQLSPDLDDEIPF